MSTGCGGAGSGANASEARVATKDAAGLGDPIAIQLNAGFKT